jgi:rRNA small subunit pseudouridine methyltransferase Nep1
LEAKVTDEKAYLVDPERHEKYIKKRLKKDPSDFNPDIAHTALLSIMDSPLNKSGIVRILVRTSSGLLIKVNPKTKVIPEVISVT